MKRTLIDSVISSRKSQASDFNWDLTGGNFNREVAWPRMNISILLLFCGRGGWDILSISVKFLEISTQYPKIFLKSSLKST